MQQPHLSDAFHALPGPQTAGELLAAEAPTPAPSDVLPAPSPVAEAVVEVEPAGELAVVLLVQLLRAHRSEFAASPFRHSVGAWDAMQQTVWLPQLCSRLGCPPPTPPWRAVPSPTPVETAAPSGAAAMPKALMSVLALVAAAAYMLA